MRVKEWQGDVVFLHEVAAGTADRGLEGILAKRLDAPYSPGRRSNAWIKTKHRRREHLAATGLRERTQTRPTELLVARRRVDGTLAPAGAVAIGVDADLLGALELSACARRGGIRDVRAPVTVAVDCHGRADGPVRDAIVRGVVIAEASE